MDHAGGLACELVLEHNNVQVDVAHADEDGHVGGANEANLLVEDEAEDGTNNECGNGLHNCTEGDAHEAIDLLRVVRERGGERAGVILTLVEELNILTEDGAEGERA